MARLLVAISPHGFGHTAQVAPVINALYQRMPNLELILRTTVPRALLESRISCKFELQEEADDFGMAQHDALDVDVSASSRRYGGLHSAWDREVERVAARLRESSPDLIMADVPYLTLAAADHAGIRAIAMCCLNWGDIYWHYCRSETGASSIRKQIFSSYNSAELFLQTEPSMPMPEVANARAIGPVAAVGKNRRDELVKRGVIGADEKLVLVAMGGIGMRLPMERWPEFRNVRFVVQQDWGVSRDDVVELESLQMVFNDVLASCDLLLTKPGYGSFVEAAANGIPVLYVPRDDWPEQPWLIKWLESVGNCRPVNITELQRGNIKQQLEYLLECKRCQPIEPAGVAEAAEILMRRLS